jgi:hypothetical protein
MQVATKWGRVMVPLADPHAQTLATLADLVVEKALAFGGSQTDRPTGEVSAVETLTRDGFSEIAKAWDPVLSMLNYQVDLHAVFVHSRPQVRWPRSNGTNGRCELADLLVVIDHKGPGHLEDRRAVLIQAKLLKGGQIKLRGKEWVQFELLSQWPAFTFVTPGYAANSRDLLDESVCENALNTGEYGGIDLKSKPPMCVQELVGPGRTTVGRISLGQLLVGMVRGADQTGRQAHIGGADDWSATVDELLRVTAALPITIASGVPRGHSHSVGIFVAEANYGMMPSLSAAGAGRDRPPPKFEVEEGDPGGPISTVRLTFTSSEHISDAT